MTLKNVTRGKQDRSIRVVIFGVEGCGKSTFGANAPKPIFLCAEDGTSHLAIAAPLRTLRKLLEQTP